MKKISLLMMCLLISCGKKIENHYSEQPKTTPPLQLEITCDDIYMHSYSDLQLHFHVANTEYMRLAKFDSQSRFMIDDLNTFYKNLKKSHKIFKSFNDIESCNGLIKNKVTTIKTKEIVTNSDELLAKIDIMIKGTNMSTTRP